MIPREIEQAVQFLLEHGAAVDARQQETQVQIGELVEQNKKLSVTVDKLSGNVDKLADGFHALRDACHSLVEHARLTDARHTRLEQSET